jgi:hypothetical protein
MTHQPDLFHRCLGRTEARQGEQFALDGAKESNRRGAECGAALVYTPSGFLACPRGHGKLRLDELDLPEEPERCGLWFEPDPA